MNGVHCHGVHQALVEELRAALHRDHGNTVLSGKFAWGPEGAPIRGSNCEAKIHLKMGLKQRLRSKSGYKVNDWMQRGRLQKDGLPMAEQNLAVATGDIQVFQSRKRMVHGEV